MEIFNSQNGGIPENLKIQTEAIADLQNACYGASFRAGWHHNPETNEFLDPDLTVPLKLVLIHSEISEALEGHRKNLVDEHLPSRSAFEVELADALIRIFDLGGAMELDLAGAIQEKLVYNSKRADHKVENRRRPDGKKY